MDTELLRTFLEVRKTRHFGRAAKNLFITQAAVSARIRLLEANLGVSLFVRQRNNIQLSNEGERLIPHAETVLRALAKARQELAVGEGCDRHLHIGVHPGIWSVLVQQRLHALLNAEPELKLRVEQTEAAALIQQLLDRTLDLAILFESPNLPELELTRIGDLTLKLYSSIAGGTVERALAEHYVSLDWGEDFARFHNCHFGEQSLPELRTNLISLAREYLGNRGGSCYLPASLGLELSALGLAPVVGAPDFCRPLNVVCYLGSPQAELIELATRHFVGVTV